MPAILIFAITYLVLAIGRLPGFRIDRTGAAIIGASFMVGVNALSLDEAYRAINFDTIILLFGMMIVVANLQLSGFFSLVAERVVEHAHRPLLLLIAIVAVAGVFSAFFVNDTMCLVLTPLVLEIAETLRRNPVPYLLAVAMAANIGSVATITGNPQNMMIGSFSGIPYRDFLAALAPVAAVGLVLAVLVIFLSYRREFLTPEAVHVEKRAVPRGSRLDVEIARGCAGDDRDVFRRLAGAQGGDRGRRRAADHAPRAAREGLPQHRLAAAGDVRRPVHRDRGRGENVARNGAGGAGRTSAPGQHVPAERPLRPCCRTW